MIWLRCVDTLRAIANGRDDGVTKLLFDDSPEAHGHGKILVGGMVDAHAGDMIGEIALAIEMGADVVDIGKIIHPTPRWAKASAWRQRWRTTAARMCRQHVSKALHTENKETANLNGSAAFSIRA